MLEKAKEEAAKNTMDISEYSEFKSKIEKGGFLQLTMVWKIRM